MEESYGEGIAIHTGPESCGHVCEGMAEALTGVCAGRVSSRESLDCHSERRRRRNGRKAKPVISLTREVIGLRAVADPAHAQKLPAQELGDPMAGLSIGVKVRAVNLTGARRR